MSRTADELKAAGKSAGWKLAPAAALKARTKATNRWLSTAAHFGNLHEVSRKVSASARAPDAALNRKFALTPNPDPVWLFAAAMKAVSSVSNVWLAERLTMGRPASVSQYVRRFRPGRRSDCGIVQGSGVTGQCVTPCPASHAGSNHQRARRDELELAVEALRETKSKAAEADYYRDLERLMLALARVYAPSAAK